MGSRFAVLCMVAADADSKIRHMSLGELLTHLAMTAGTLAFGQSTPAPPEQCCPKITVDWTGDLLLKRLDSALERLLEMRFCLRTRGVACARPA